MKKQKLILNNLKVQSFVTSLKQNEVKTIQGGTNPKWIIDAYKIAAGISELYNAYVDKHHTVGECDSLKCPLPVATQGAVCDPA